ncbi:GAF domain-containing protein [Streptosporangium fragile]|uniref:GAF domain-containing protein n=1 Tax=Streptosporangium fragile TaxID=46186 RepID=A0ABP6I748_9ACTN
MGSDQQLSAVRIATDAVGLAPLLAEVRHAVLNGDRTAVVPRPVVSESWQRCLRAGLDPDRPRSLSTFDAKTVYEMRAGHPLAQVLPLLRSTLLCVAEEALHVMVVTDVQGHVLWMDGQSDVRRLADRFQFVEGVRWAEDTVGTNAIGTALAIDRPVQIYASEHYASGQHVWTCAAAPVHDPDTGAVLGVVDVSGPFQTIHPATSALVNAAARLAEEHLRIRMTARDERLRQRNMVHLDRLRGAPGALLNASGRILATSPAGWVEGRLDVPAEGGECLLPSGDLAVAEPIRGGFLVRSAEPGHATRTSRPTLKLTFLGADPPMAVLAGRPTPLTLRHAELLAMLALHPKGLTADQLAAYLYGDAGNPVTVRAEMHRLRALLGGVVEAKPYRLTAAVEADFVTARNLLGTGRVADVLDEYRGALLPLSDAPAVRDEREELTAAVRRTVIDRGDAAAVLRWTELDEGREDLEALSRLLRLLPPADPRRAAVVARYDRLCAQAAHEARLLQRLRHSPARPGTGAPPTRRPR